ncbi:MAG: multicopper oxidase domain-containing protein [Rhodocyclales bacterium]|nr:multicopper oxidase domain-containing protein [Rhodocyclales bacterium]MBI5785680.1 multicopper oxidase domain-containing protein [Rhodocyclales bacterium]
MKPTNLRKLLFPLAIAAAFATSLPAAAGVYVQCPGDTNGDAVPDGAPNPNLKCMHLSGGDGFSVMADGKQLYTFGFSDLTGTGPGTEGIDDRLDKGILAAQQPAPTIELNQGQQFFLTLTNVGMLMRPDLFDPHSVHFHGFPNASAIFDGLPESGITINMGASLTYFYNILDPGTYIYHCHVEATEHMEMGMLGQIYVKPAQDGQSITYGGKTYTQFVYNDIDGGTGYHKGVALQLGSFDHVFHEKHIDVQPLPFAKITTTYSLFNGRGYPDTVNPASIPAGSDNPRAVANGGGIATNQPLTSLVTLDRATEGSTLLLRLSNLSVDNLFSVTALGLPMRVVGQGARILRTGGEATGKDLSYNTAAITLGGGETSDVLIDTSGVPAGTYFLYTTNLNYLSNGAEDFGGMMTEIVITN